MRLYRFSSNVPFFVDCPLSGAIDIGISHSPYNQAPKKVILYESSRFWGLTFHISQDPRQELSYANQYN
jgi:hypothetical protein